jgi:hypothetical protein
MLLTSQVRLAGARGSSGCVRVGVNPSCFRKFDLSGFQLFLNRIEIAHHGRVVITLAARCTDKRRDRNFHDVAPDMEFLHHVFLANIIAITNNAFHVLLLPLRRRKMPLLLLLHSADAIAVDDGIVLRDGKERIVELFFGDVRHFPACDNLAI